MGRKRSPIMSKALDFIALSCLTPMSKMKRPIAHKLLLLKRIKRRRFDHLRHHNYAFIAEYQFSPFSSPSPLFVPSHPPQPRSNRFLSLLCGSDGGGASEEELEMLSPPRRVLFRDELHTFSPEGDGTVELSENGDEEDENVSVDQRAERFIEKFYEQIRIQRQESAAARAIEF
ncbi:hypothetical protein Cni_G06411 [Canna indica]|uniref:Cotton fiber protein n=1 Tax=Canna indica TaxID=4628 RepID=A0AAQ3Q4R1_9LILI|nr:hypothetical protein Cni_G06411 [Canna indica]